MTLKEKEELITQELEKLDPVLITMLDRIKNLVDELNRMMMDDSIDSNEKYFFLLNLQFNPAYQRFRNFVDVIEYLKDPLDEDSLNFAMAKLVMRLQENSERILH